MSKEILFLNPVFTHNIWGGTKLRDVFGYQIEGDDIGECWGVAAHDNGDCTVSEGTYVGQKLSTLWKEHREQKYEHLSFFYRKAGNYLKELVKLVGLKQI